MFSVADTNGQKTTVLVTSAITYSKYYSTRLYRLLRSGANTRLLYRIHRAFANLGWAARSFE